ncbi:cation:proton antiporter [Corynebacterium sp. UBA2622]|uniref:cation:proton antiporter n=1 Tax=Corynebacterium sp. UBA2622 TaxID=1946393 RepID=UPI0025C2E7CA|nr:cation:proton antiporter [Corynebacterium sp. UBA2622]
MNFAQLSLICLVALLGPALALSRAARVPVVIGELLVGLVLGATGFRVLDSADPTFGFLAEIGFALVMFIAGSHVPVRDPALRTGAAKGVARALGVAALSVPLAMVAAHVFHTPHAALYAVLMASSSASLVMPALDGAPLSGRSMVSMLPQLALADAASIVALPFVIDPAHVVRASLGAAAVLAAAVAVYFFLNYTESHGYRRRVHRVSEDRGLAIELRLSLAILFGLAALAQLTHVSVMLAGFSFGIAVAAIGTPRRLAKQVFALSEGFFAPIFFVWLGASLNLRDLVTHPGAVLLGLTLGGCALLAHGLMALTRQPLPVALTTAAQLGVPVAAATTGTQLHLLAPGEDTAILLGALVTIAATTLLSGPLARIAEREAADTAEAPRA